jgi:hypothetical protein
MKSKIIKMMAIIIERNIRVSSILVDFLKKCLQSTQKRRVFILVFPVALLMVILVWIGLLVSLAFCLSLGFSGLYLFIATIIEVSRFDYFALSLFLIGLASVCAGIPYFKNLRNSFKSGEILIEQLLPVIGVILWLLGLMGVAIWLVI